MMIWHPEAMAWEEVKIKQLEAPSMQVCEEALKQFAPDATETIDGHKFVIIYTCTQGV